VLFSDGSTQTNAVFVAVNCCCCLVAIESAFVREILPPLSS